MKKRFRLKKDEVEFLKLKPKNNNRYTLSNRQSSRLLDYRKKKVLGDGIVNEIEKNDLNINDIKHGWLKSDGASFFFTNPFYKSEEYEEFQNNLIDLIHAHKPNYPKIKRSECKDGHLLVVNPADVHIGKLADSFETNDEYNIEIAINRAYEGIRGILDKSKGFNIDKIVFIGGNDILHIDTPRRTTTSGTPQDTDGMWYNAFLKAFDLYINVLKILTKIADVHFIYCPSNHDYTNGFFLCQAVQAYFNENKNITFDCSISYRKYFVYGSNLLGFSHGDGGKISDLPLAMAHESKEWSSCKHKYIYIHHVHHKTSKDYMSVNVESMRSPSGADSWHHRNLYCNNIKAIEGFLHHKEFGQIARLNHIF